MREIRYLNDIKKLEPFTKILVVDEENRDVKEYIFLYNLHKNNYYPDEKMYLTNDKFDEPIEMYPNSLHRKCYVDYTKIEKEAIEAKIKVEREEMIKLSMYEKYHFGYVKGKIVYFDISPRWLKIRGIDGKDVDFTADDIETVFIRKPKFNELKNTLPKLAKEDKTKYINNLSEGKYRYYIKNVDGKTLQWMQHDRDSRKELGYFEYVEFEPNKSYTLYCSVYDGRDEDYHNVNYIEED